MQHISAASMKWTEENVVLRDYDLLEYLHDAKCLDVVWDCSDPRERLIHVSVVVHHEAGYPQWDGKKLRITLSDVVIANSKCLGYRLGEETLDCWRVSSSDTFEQECIAMKASGIVVPTLRFLVSFHSGSLIELACSRVSIVEMM